MRKFVYRCKDSDIIGLMMFDERIGMKFEISILE